MRSGFIYALVDPRTNAVRYIGATTNKHRPRKHGTPHRMRADAGTERVRWISELQAAGLQYGVRQLEQLPADDLELAEQFWIAQGRGLGWPLTNITRGGRGRRAPCPAAGRERIGQALQGRAQSAEQKAKSGAAVQAHIAANPRSAEHRAKLSAALKGRAPAAASMVRTPEWRRRMSEAQRERRRREREAKGGG